MKKVDYYFNPEDGSSLCTISFNNRIFVGTAQCSENDKDMLSEKTGCEIAYRRASIYALKYEKDTIKSELNGLKKYYYTVCRSKYYNKNGYMETMLKRQLAFQQNRLEEITNLLKYNQESLKDYLKNKEIFYKRIRKMRNGQD